MRMKIKLIAVFVFVAGIAGLWFTEVTSFCGGVSQEATAHLISGGPMRTYLYRFRADVGRFPTTQEGLTALICAPKGTESLWRGPYIEGKNVPRDPWNNEYQYRFPAAMSKDAYDVWSLGRDGIVSADDIGNWEK